MVNIEVLNKDNYNAREVVALMNGFAEKTGSKVKADQVCFSIGAGQSILLKVFEEDDFKGFLVVSEEATYDYGKELYIWVANFAKPASDDVIETTMDTLKSFAGALCAKRIKFGTNRLGWQRRAKRFGFKKAEEIYEVLL